MNAALAEAMAEAERRLLERFDEVTLAAIAAEFEARMAVCGGG